MHYQSILPFLLYFIVLIYAQDAVEDQSDLQNPREKVDVVLENNGDITRQKRTLYVKDNLFGTGTIGLGVGFGGGSYRGSRYGYYSRPRYSGYTNYYGNRYPYYNERPSYVDRPHYYDRPSYGYNSPYWSRPNTGYGWGGNNNYANSQASSLSATGNFGPISGSVSTSHASSSAGSGSGYHNGYDGYEYNDGFHY